MAPVFLMPIQLELTDLDILILVLEVEVYTFGAKY
jgi:hypothetical protein